MNPHIVLYAILWRPPPKEFSSATNSNPDDTPNYL